MGSRWTRNQMISAVGVVISAIAVIISIGTRQKIQPVMEMKPQIVNVINNITKVEKEIANIREVIHQQYASFTTEEFRKRDLGRRMVVPSKDSVLFTLQTIPEAHSVQITNSIGMVAPANTYTMSSKTITLHRDITADRVLEDEGSFYVIKYVPDTTSDSATRQDDGITARQSDRAR